MPSELVLNIDLANVYRTPDSKSARDWLTTIAWGDHVDVDEAGSTDEALKVRITRFETLPDGSIQPRADTGFIRPSRSSGLKPQDLIVPREQSSVLKVNFVDVQQGDASVIETPQGRIVLIDGGDNQLFARYLANRFPGTSVQAPQQIDAIVVTHGDADHFLGLTEISKSETNSRLVKRLFIRPQRVYHNGLVKRPSKRDGERVPEGELLGATRPGPDGRPVIVDLAGDLLAVPDAEMNEPFREWKAALRSYADRYGSPEFRRLQQGDDDAFDFLADEGITIRVLGPLPTEIDGQTGLTFLGEPVAAPQIRDAEAMAGPRFRGLSASHTINGHSIVLHLAYKQFHFLFAGDLNAEAEGFLVAAHEQGEVNLQAEVFKVPHHGSADFAGEFLAAVSPVVSVVSSGDESARKEYIHPRATLMGALGKYSRLDEPLIFVTELVAFFDFEGLIVPEAHKREGDGLVEVPKPRPAFFAFSRAAYGIVKIRTDGERLLVYTSSGQKRLNEAYAFRMEPSPEPGAPDIVRPIPVVRA
jgi:beta-lactamase superfamily II metal-dependent hydrolase